MAAPPRHRINIQVEVEQRIRSAQQALPQQFELQGYAPPQAQAMAQRAFEHYRPQAEQMTRDVYQELFENRVKGRFVGMPDARRAEWLQKATAFQANVLANASFTLGRTGTSTITSGAASDTGNILPPQAPGAAAIQLAQTRSAAFERAILTGAPAYFESKSLIAGQGSTTKVRAAPIGELYSRIKDLREADPRFRPSYFDPGISGVEDLLRQAADETVPISQRTNALFAAQETLASLSGRYESERATRASGRRVLREERGESSGRVVERRLGRRVQRAAGAFAAIGARATPAMAQQLQDLQDFLGAYPEGAAEGYGPEMRFDIETRAAELERQALAQMGPTERQAYAARSRLAGARTARQKLEEAMRGPVDLSAPGKRRAVALTAAQQARFAQAQADIRQAEALVAMPADQQTATDQARAALLSKQAADAIKSLTSEIKGNTKAQNDSNKMMADFTPRQALGMAMVTRALGGRVSGVLSGLASGAAPGQVAASTVAGVTGSLQDMAFNNFIQNPTRLGFGLLAGATAASVVGGAFSAFANRGYQLRGEVMQRLGDRYSTLAGVLTGPSLVSDIYGSGGFTGVKSGLKVGDVVTNQTLKSLGIGGYGIKPTTILQSGAAALSSLTPSEQASIEKRIADISSYKGPGTDTYTLNLRYEHEVAAFNRGVALRLAAKERERLQAMDTEVRARYSYGGLVELDEAGRAAASISAQGGSLRRFAAALSGAQGGTQAQQAALGVIGRAGASTFRGAFGNALGLPGANNYIAGVSERGIGAYATYLSKMGLDQKAVESAIAMQSLGLMGTGLRVDATGMFKSRALDTFAYAVQQGLPSTAAAQIMGTSTAMAREGMFTDLTSLAEHTRGMSAAGVTPGTIGMVQTGMMQTRRSTLSTLTGPMRQLNEGMALMYALQQSGGDYFAAIEAVRSGKADMGSPEYKAFLQTQLGTSGLAGGILQAQGARLGDVGKIFGAGRAPLKAGEEAELSLTSFITASIEAATKAKQEAGAAVTPTEEAVKASREGKLDEIATTLARVADTLAALIY